MLQVGVEDEGEYHQVHREEEPDVNHLEVRCGWQGLKKERSIWCIFLSACHHLNTSSDGGDDQHEGEADHDPVLQEDAQVCIPDTVYLR